MKRTNSVTDALNTNKVLVDVGDGIVIPLPTDGVFGGAQGKPGVGVPDGGTSGQVVQRTASGTIWATPSKDLVGLTKVDNTADLEKPLSEPQALALTNKADLIGGKVPSSQLPEITPVTDSTIAPLINGATTGAAIDARFNTQVAPQVQKITADYIAGDRTVVDAAAAAVNAAPKIVQLETVTIPRALTDAKSYADAEVTKDRARLAQAEAADLKQSVDIRETLRAALAYADAKAADINKSISTSHVALDADGTPYFRPGSTTVSVQQDTDGTPFYETA